MCSYVISNKINNKQIEHQNNIARQNHDHEEYNRLTKLMYNANMVRLDIATALFHSIRNLKESLPNKYLYIIPINKNYYNIIESLSSKLSFTELSDLYQLYAILEKVNKDIYSYNLNLEEDINNLKVGFDTILYKVYGERYKEVIKVDVDKISFEQLIDNNLILENYKNILSKLNIICSPIEQNNS